MAEENAALESGSEGIAVDPVAMTLALGGASSEDAKAFLAKQGRLVDLQCEYLADKDTYELSHLRWRRFTEQMKGALQALTVVVGIAFAASISYMVWDAAHSSGLIIEPFVVPSDMTAKGLSGQVIASQMLDRLTAMQDATDSARSPQSYANNWGDNIKVEIPQTGISIGEVQNFFKRWLGHDTHITGEVWRTQTGIAVTAREGAQAGATFTGPENDLDALVQKAAEHVYSATQPYRYANFLVYRDLAAPDFADRRARAAAIYHQLIAGPSALERAWAWNGLGSLESANLGSPVSAYYYRKATEASPDFTMGYFGMGLQEQFLGHDENSLAATLKAKTLLDRSNTPDINPRQLSLRRLRNDGYLALTTGDFSEGVRILKIGGESPGFANLGRAQFTGRALAALAGQHDGGGVRGYMRDLGISSIQKRFGNRVAFPVAVGLEDWPAILRMENAMPQSVREQMYRGNGNRLLPAVAARAHAQMGDISGAETLIASTPADCDDCVIARGQIAEMQGQHGRADSWFDRVAKRQPSIPFADAAWGRALLGRNQPDAAVEKFKSSNTKGPHFADPLEGWGEALMAKNQSHLALAKFTEAEKYAPNWGRLHLKWGEALIYSGKPDAAKSHFARATALDLTPSEKSELARVTHV
jgi:hypothetical protein